MDVEERREMMVRKSNDLIQTARFSLSVTEQRVVLYLISLIKPEDTQFKECAFSLSDFCRVAGIGRGGNTDEVIETALEKLWKKTIGWATLYDGSRTILAWIEKPRISQDGNIILKLDDDLRPYLLNLAARYTAYELLFTLRCRCQYSIRLYEVVKSIHFNELDEYRHIYTIDELRSLMGAETYSRYADFKRRALLPAVDEINRLTDKTVSVNEIMKNKKSVRALELLIESKSPVDVIRIHAENEEKSDGIWHRMLSACEEGKV